MFPSENGSQANLEASNMLSKGENVIWILNECVSLSISIELPFKTIATCWLFILQPYIRAYIRVSLYSGIHSNLIYYNFIVFCIIHNFHTVWNYFFWKEKKKIFVALWIIQKLNVHAFYIYIKIQKLFYLQKINLEKFWIRITIHTFLLTFWSILMLCLPVSWECLFMKTIC